MKQLYILFIFMGLLYPAMQSYAQSDFNYLRTTSATSEDGTGLINTSYYDDWGRLWEDVQQNVDQFNRDRITYYEYDCRGQLEKAWKPVIVNYNFGNIYPTSLLKTVYKNYYGTDEMPYSLTTYENSPLCRSVKNIGAGAQWHNNDKVQKTRYLTNNSDYPCRTITTTEDRQLILLNIGQLHSNGGLLVTESEDEDGNLQYEFRDKRDRVIMKRQQDNEEFFDTYFVYDSYGNLRSVLPPMAADVLVEDSVLDESNEIIQKYAFLYKYDARNRCIAKKLPGCEWEYFIYDLSDKLIFSQDGNQRSQAIPKWTFYLYDAFQRMVLKGVCSNGQLGDIVSTLVTCVWDGEEGIDHSGYTANIELNSPEVHIANYYDGYEFLARSGFSASHFPAATINAKGYLTGTVSRVLGSDVDSFVYKALYYDLRGRVVSQVTNNWGKYDLIHTDYTFTGKPLHVRIEHLHGNAVHTEQYSYTYGYEERLDKVEYQIDDRTPIVMSEQHYDDLGRLSEKLFHNGMYSNHYTYNIRDWLTGVNGTHFSQSLHYTDGIGTPCYNGNISSMTWSTDSLITKGYTLTYDGLSRLKNAVYGEGPSLSDNLNRFNEQVTDYDKNGNILGLLRYGQTSSDSYGLVDNLHLVYDGNQLESVSDNVTLSAALSGMEFEDNADLATEYVYDANGNLIKDLNKNIIDIQYNFLNLPCRVEFENGNSISYLYDANGTKLRTTHVIGNDTTVTDYCGNVIYENGAPKTLLVEGGYVSLDDNKYHYFIQDHQGNNRVVVDEDGKVEEVNDYYPFGGLMASSVGSVQPYKYNGKELDRKGGLDWYDYGARQYDAALGRWHSVDPLAEKFYPFSPYNYCFDNPVKYIDPDGKQGRPTRPPVRRGYRNGGRPNPYAFYPRGMRPQSYVQKTSMTYRGNGTRQMVGMGPQAILNTVNTPGGNEVQMSNNNEFGMWLSGFGDLTSNHIEFREKLISLVSTMRYGEDGNVQNSTEIVIDDPQLAMQQLDYEMKAREIEKGLGEVDFTGKSLVESLEMLAERKKVIQDKIGISPKEVIQTELFLHPERFRFGTSTRRILPELIQH